MLLLAVFVFGAGALAALLMRQHRRASALDEAMAVVRPAAERVRRQTKSVQLVDAVLAQRKRLASQLAGLFAQTPQSIVLETLAFERGRQELIVRGQAPSTQAVLEYIQQLEQLDGIESVSLKYSRRRSGSADGATEFEVVCRQAAS
jgi:Tfp pilus assembly protein PilN